MRQRRVKHLKEKMEPLEYLFAKIYEEDKPFGDVCQNFKNPHNPLYIEIGCGKGKFITNLAKDNVDKNYIAIEMQQSVIYYAMKKVDAEGLDNVRFINKRLAEDDLKEIFGENKVDGIYLNFSDPWPKMKHYKRRLTYREKLYEYAYILKDGGFIEFKTDNDELFKFSVEEVQDTKDEMLGEGLELKITEQSVDLHKSQFSSKDYKTEYEEKFILRDKNINYLHINLTKSIHSLY